MMTILTILFLVLSISFKSISLVAKTVNAGTKRGINVTKKQSNVLAKIKNFTRKRKEKSMAKRRESKGVVNFLKSKSQSRNPVKKAYYKSRLIPANIIHKKNVAKSVADDVAYKSVSVTDESVKATRLGLRTAYIANKVSELSAKAISTVFKFLSWLCGLLIPIDIILTLIALVIIIAAAVVAVLFYNGGILDKNAQDNKSATVSSSTSAESEIIDNDKPANNESKEYTGTDYKKTSLGWIYLSQSDERWGSYKHGNNGETCADSACGTTCASMVLTHFNTEGKVYTPDVVTQAYVDSDKGSWGTLAYASQNCVPTEINDIFPNITAKCSSPISGGLDFNTVDETLSAGGCVIADFHSQDKYEGVSIWTTAGHYVMICGGNQNDGYRVLDPNGGHESGTRGIKAWAPYSEHTFDKQYMSKSVTYYYTITLK